MPHVPPSLILVMRHAEKRHDPADPNLSHEGAARALKLATYIPQQFGRPDVLIAAANSKHSERPTQTLTPLADQLGLSIDDSIADQEYALLAQDLLTGDQYSSKRIVVCWHHGNIPPLMQALGAADGTYPDPWPNETFDIILKAVFTDQLIQITQITESFHDDSAL